MTYRSASLLSIVEEFHYQQLCVFRGHLAFPPSITVHHLTLTDQSYWYLRDRPHNARITHHESSLSLFLVYKTCDWVLLLSDHHQKTPTGCSERAGQLCRGPCKPLLITPPKDVAHGNHSPVGLIPVTTCAWILGMKTDSPRPWIFSFSFSFSRACFFFFYFIFYFCWTSGKSDKDRLWTINV